MTSKKVNSEYLLETLMSNISDSIYFKDRQSRFIKTNKVCAKKHGMESPQEMFGETDFGAFTKEHAEKAYTDEIKIMRTGKPLPGMEEKETRPDGRVTWASTTKMPLKNFAGEIIGTFGISRDITQRKEVELNALRAAEKMRCIKEEMEEDFRMAGELQKTFFPSCYPEFPAGAAPEERCVEFLHRFTACSKVGGDYCSIQRVSNTEAGIFLCDVEGVGVRSALGTALIRGIVQELSPLGLDPGAYLSRMNDLLFPLVNHGEGLIHVSASYLILNTVSGQVRFASAGSPEPLIFRQKGGAQWLCKDRMRASPLLASKPKMAYSSIECHVEAGDAVVLYTDGLFSAENSVGDPYGTKRLLDSAHSFAGEALADIFHGLEGDALAFSKTGAFTDDVCLVGFQLRPA